MHWFLKFIFGIKLYTFRIVSLYIIRSFSLYTQQWYMSYRFADSLRAGSGRNCTQAVSKPVWHIPLLCVHWKSPDDGQRNCPKHVEFYSKNKFEKLVHLVGFIIRNCHDARSRELQTSTCYLCATEALHNLMSLKICNAHMFKTSHPRGDESLSTHLWKPQILPCSCYCYKVQSEVWFPHNHIL